MFSLTRNYDFSFAFKKKNLYRNVRLHHYYQSIEPAVLFLLPLKRRYEFHSFSENPVLYCNPPFPHQVETRKFEDNKYKSYVLYY